MFRFCQSSAEILFRTLIGHNSITFIGATAGGLLTVDIREPEDWALISNRNRVWILDRYSRSRAHGQQQDLPMPSLGRFLGRFPHSNFTDPTPRLARTRGVPETAGVANRESRGSRYCRKRASAGPARRPSMSQTPHRASTTAGDRGSFRSSGLASAIAFARKANAEDA